VSVTIDSHLLNTHTHISILFGCFGIIYTDIDVVTKIKYNSFVQ